MSNKLKAITTKAKALYKTGRYKKWTDAIKAASKSTAKVNGVKKKTAPKKKTAVRNYGSHKDTHSHNVKISVMSGHLEASKLKHLQMLKDYYGKLQAEFFTAKGKHKTQIKKTMSLIKKDILKLK